MNVLRIGPTARQGRQDNTMSEIVRANFNRGEEFWSRHGVAECKDDHRYRNGTIFMRVLSASSLEPYDIGTCIRPKPGYQAHRREPRHIAPKTCRNGQTATIRVRAKIIL